MSTKIRFARGGRTGLPFYRLVVANSTSARDGKFIEKLGTYDPLLDDKNNKRFVFNKERVEYWLSVGAHPTTRVALLLSSSGVTSADKYKPKITPKQKGEATKKKKKA